MHWRIGLHPSRKLRLHSSECLRENFDHVLHLGDDPAAGGIDSELVRLEPVSAMDFGEVTAYFMRQAHFGAELDLYLVAEQSDGRDAELAAAQPKPDDREHVPYGLGRV